MKLFRVADDYCRASNWKILPVLRGDYLRHPAAPPLAAARHWRSRGGVCSHLHSPDGQLLPFLGQGQRLSRTPERFPL